MASGTDYPIAGGEPGKGKDGRPIKKGLSLKMRFTLY
jgi:hypothetical protein